MRSDGSRFTWGSGGEAVFAKSRVCDRNRRQPFATVRNRPQPSATVRNRPRWRRKALHSGECVWSGPESVSSWVVAPQLYWRLQGRCLCEWSVSPQLFWRLQRRCLCEWSVSPQVYWRLQRRCLCEWSVSPQFYWRLQRRCLCEWSVSSKSVLQERHVRIALQECQARVSCKSVSQKCQVRVSSKSVK